MERSLISDTVKEALKNVLMLDTLPSEESTIKEDLNADSLDVVEFIMNCEEEFGIDISDDDSDKLITVKDVVNFIEERTCPCS